MKFVGDMTPASNPAGSAVTDRSVASAVAPNGATTLDQALAPQPGSIRGLVSDAPTGRPVAGATVSAGSVSTTTDARGQYALGSIAADTAVTVSASHPDYVAIAASSMTVTLAAGASGTANLQLQPRPASLDGVVTDQASGATLSGVSVQGQDALGAVIANVTTGLDGHYHLASLTPGSLTLTFAASGYASATAPIVLAPNATGTANQVLVANPIGTSLTLALAAGSAEPSSADQSFTLVAHVVPNSLTSGGLSGSVTFTNGTTLFGTSALDDSGTATLALSGFAPGTYSFTADYAGDARFSASTSPAFWHQVLGVQAASAASPTTSTSSGGGGGAPGHTTSAPTTPPLGGGAALDAAVAPAGPTVVPAAPAVPADAPAPGSSTPRALVVAPSPASGPASSAPASGDSVSDDAASAQAQLHLRADLVDADTGALVGQVIVEPTSPDLGTGLLDGIRIDVIGSTNVERHLTSDPDEGALGGGNAARIAPPVDLNLVAHSTTSGEQVLLPDGVRALTFHVSLPVLAYPTDPDETFTWLAAVQQDGQPAGYMRYPSTYDPDTGMLVYEMPATVLLSTAVLPVIIQPAWVQSFLPEVHIWSSPFHDGQDLGLGGELWATYRVAAPQVAGRIGIVQPETGEMVWIEAVGVGPTEDPEASSL